MEKCRKEYQKEYYLNNKDNFKENSKEYYLNNKDNFKKHNKEYYLNNKDNIKENKKKYYLNNKDNFKEKAKRYRENNKEKINKARKEKRKKNPLFKLRGNISSLIRFSIKNQGYTKRSKTYKILGCTFEEFKIHLEKQFTKGMTWENQGEWHLDHIYPVSLAKDEKHLIELNHYTNFQPLWAIDNIIKGNKIL